MDIILKEEKWYWPEGASGDSSWNHQHLSLDLFSKIKPHLKGSSVAVQAGGNCGFILSQFVEHFDHIYTFEPDPVNFMCLAMNITSPKVIKLQACIGDANGLVGISNELNDIGAVHVSSQGGHIPMLKIDDLKLERCDLIQLDVEGYEYNALVGAKETIRKFGPVICAEWYEPWAHRFGITRGGWDAFFTVMGYTHVVNDGNDEIYVRK